MAYVKKEDRNPFRDLRHKLVSDSQTEIERYEAKLQEDLRSDARDHIEAAKERTEKKDGLEGLGSKSNGKK